MESTVCFWNGTESTFVFLIGYLCDMQMCSNSDLVASTVIDAFKTRFEQSVRSCLKNVLGISMKTRKNFVKLCNAQMIDRLLKRFDIKNYKIYMTLPLDSNKN